MIRVTQKGVVCAGRLGTDRSSCAFAQIAALPSGRWLCAFRAAPRKQDNHGQHVCLTWSDDEGETWSDPVSPFDPPPIDGRPGAFRAAAPTAFPDGRILLTLYWVDHSDPDLPFFNEETEGLLDSRILHAWSDDDGRTWTDPILMDTTPFYQPTPITGPALCLPNGELACQFELNKHYDDLGVWRHAPVLMFSADGGQTWPEHAIPAQDESNRIFYWDQRPCVLPDGLLLDVFWTYDTTKARYLNIHACESADNGRTWSALWDTGVPGQPAPVIALGEGKLLMIYVDRTAAPAIKARFSEDSGRTWPIDTEIVIETAAVASQTQQKSTMQDAWAEMGAFSLGLPATTPLPHGGVLVVYYAGPETDVTDVRWARLGVD